MRLKRLLVAPLLLSIACKQPTPGERLDSVLSWLATAGMAGEAWLRHTTPDNYTRETLELSHETLRQLADQLLQSPVPAVDTARLDSVLTRSRGRVAQMARFVEARNSPALSRELESLRADERIVRQFAASLEHRQ